MTYNAARLQLAATIRLARAAKGLTWTKIADAIGRDRVWTVAALLGQHPLSGSDASTVAALLDLDDDAVAMLRSTPYRGTGVSGSSDPAIYRFHEALSLYGPALKELIAEEFGDGIMSAVNFRMSVQRRPDPQGDRVIVTFDGKFLDYTWNNTEQEVMS
ncbi:cyanase [Mycobacterium kansasii]|uniref:Cyanate hydratase n=1 Tax=Mycobacterium attenuatum TaxID=2341086 RepID=A0A498Q705_9MYCO|nr:cyanase [Mycobacterium attenuatum]ORB82730.1 cyanase [Mycobacterium kansasii]VBA39570.1 Cyanate hydratase [Mycobacterium attenuatum]